MAIFSPVILWNAARGWESFAFQAGRAAGGGAFRPWLLLGAIGAQALYILPWLWPFVVSALGRAAFRSWRRSEPGPAFDADRFLVMQALPPLLAFFLVACRRPVFPHWALIGLVPAFPLLGRDWASRWPEGSNRLGRRLFGVSAATLAGVAVFLVQAKTGFLQPGRLGLLPPRNDPTVEMFGWDQVVGEIRRRGLLERPGQFVFTSKWYYSGHLAFETGNRVPVLCYDPRGGHAFAEWEDSADWVGHDGLLVTMDRSGIEPAMFGRWFAWIEPVGEFDVIRAGEPVRKVRLYRCLKQMKPFPAKDVRTRMARSDSAGDGRLR